jgi:hypothetical protein
MKAPLAIAAAATNPNTSAKASTRLVWLMGIKEMRQKIFTAILARP